MDPRNPICKAGFCALPQTLTLRACYREGRSLLPSPSEAPTLTLRGSEGDPLNRRG